MAPESQDGLVCAYRLDGQGGAKALDWAGVEGWKEGDGTLWAHIDRKSDNALTWLRQRAGLDPLVCEALLTEEARPRLFAAGQGLILILRGVNLNPGADPDDMVSIRLLIEPNRVISLRHRRLMAVQDLRERLEKGTGPKDTGDIMVGLADRMVARMGPVIDELEDSLDELEDGLLDEQTEGVRHSLAPIRRQAIRLRRYIAPQREVMSRSLSENAPFLADGHRARLREVADHLTRYVEDLDSSRERSAIIQDELANRLSQRMDKTMYVLSLVAAIFLPLGFLTGLLGINVGGIPGTESDAAFWIVCGLMTGLTAAMVWVFKKARWL